MSRPQTEEELRALLVEQFDWLADSAEAYDRGSESDAKRIAVVVRTLVHDTAASRSLLDQLGLKNTLSFAARNYVFAVFAPWNLWPVFHGLVGIVIDPQLGPAFIPHYDKVPPRLVLFSEWWSEPVLGRSRQRLFTRKDLVLTLAKKEGGTHVDPACPPPSYLLTCTYVVWHIYIMSRARELSAEVERWFGEEFGRLWPVALGSLSLRRSPCIRKTCQACESGEQHSSYVLYGRQAGRRFAVYVPDGLVPRVRRALENGRALQGLLYEAGRRYVEALKRERIEPR